MRSIVTSLFLALVLLLTVSFAWAQYDQRNSSNPYMGMDLRTKMALEERDKRIQEQRARGGATGGATTQKGRIQIKQPPKQQIIKPQQAIKQPIKQPPKQQAIKQQQVIKPPIKKTTR